MALLRSDILNIELFKAALRCSEKTESVEVLEITVGMDCRYRISHSFLHSTLNICIGSNCCNCNIICNCVSSSTCPPLVISQWAIQCLQCATAGEMVAGLQEVAPVQVSARVRGRSRSFSWLTKISPAPPPAALLCSQLRLFQREEFVYKTLLPSVELRR